MEILGDFFDYSDFRPFPSPPKRYFPYLKTYQIQERTTKNSHESSQSPCESSPPIHADDSVRFMMTHRKSYQVFLKINNHWYTCLFKHPYQSPIKNTYNPHNLIIHALCFVRPLQNLLRGDYHFSFFDQNYCFSHKINKKFVENIKKRHNQPKISPNGAIFAIITYLKRKWPMTSARNFSK